MRCKETRGAVEILAARRTPFGKFCGSFRYMTAPQLAAVAIKNILDASSWPLCHAIDGVYLGQAIAAGSGQHAARHAGILAGLRPGQFEAVSVNKVCASSLAALEIAVLKIRSGDAEVVLAGGMESMSTAPFLLRRFAAISGEQRMRELMRDLSPVLWDETLRDAMAYDGLVDAGSGESMGTLADACAEAFGVSRAAQERFAHRSHLYAWLAQKRGWFDAQIAEVAIPRLGLLPKIISYDECVRRPDNEAMRRLPVAFPRGEPAIASVTAATSSKIADGAAVLLLASPRAAKRLETQRVGRILAFATAPTQAERYVAAPVGAIARLLQKTGLTIRDIDLFEINEAFAVVPLLAMRALGIPRERVNIHGGAMALGHPLGASGARITMEVLCSLRAVYGRYGIAAACNGGGEAVAVLVENVARR